MAFGRSSRPTISTTKDCRVGMSTALTTPSSPATTRTMGDRDLAGEGERAEDAGEHGRRRLREQQQAATVHPVRHRAAERREEEDRGLSHEPRHAQEQGRVGETVDEPGLRHHLQPRADERHELSPDVEPEVAVPQRADDPGGGLHPATARGG